LYARVGLPPEKKKEGTDIDLRNLLLREEKGKRKGKQIAFLMEDTGENRERRTTRKVHRALTLRFDHSAEEKRQG